MFVQEFVDPLSDVLSLLKLRSYSSGGLDAGGDWALGFPSHEGVKFYAVVTGECWLSVDEVAEPVHVEAGDCFLLPTGRPFVIASDLGRQPVDARETFFPIRQGGINTYNGGGAFFSVGGHFALSGPYAKTLSRVLSPIVHLTNEPDKAALRWCAERMSHELRNPQPGSFLVAQQLASLLLVQGLREHLLDPKTSGIGWLFALADKQIAAALDAIHHDPGGRWTLASLAKCAGMSRTAFAMRFKGRVGMTPIGYLTDWRMQLAGDRLLSGSESISVIGPSLGYASESSFSSAFKRTMGSSPRTYLRARTAILPEADDGDRGTREGQGVVEDPPTGSSAAHKFQHGSRQQSRRERP